MPGWKMPGWALREVREEMNKQENEPKEIPIRFIENEEDQKATAKIPAVDVASDAPLFEAAADGAKTGAADADPSGNPGGSNGASDPPAEAAAEIERLGKMQAQIDGLTQERSTLLDQLLRRQAEFENYRRRAERERTETYARARAEVVLELLPVIDNFERALASLEHVKDDAASLRHGIELIHRQLQDALAKFGLEPVVSVGQAFDPHVHEAVSAEPSAEHEENTVIAEFQRGYRLGEKLLRPAKVKVASSPDK